MRAALSPLRHGRGDPCTQLGPAGAWRATRTPVGPVAVHLRVEGAGARPAVEARAWGPGAEAALEALPALLGAEDDPGSFRPRHPLVAELHRRRPGLRLGRSGAVTEVLVPTVLEQRVTGGEAFRSWARLARRLGGPAPGPAGRAGLVLPPEPAALGRLASWELHRLGVERQRGDTLRRVARLAGSLDRLAALPSPEAQRRLGSVRGVGPWSVAHVAATALGDADAVPVGDYHLPHLVSWALLGERRGSDERMLELLEPFRPHRGRALRLLLGVGGPPRRVPRARVQPIHRR